MSYQINKNTFKTTILNRFNLHLPCNEPPRDQRFAEIVRGKLSELNSKELETLCQDWALKTSLVDVLSLCELSEEEFKAYIEALKNLPNSFSQGFEVESKSIIAKAIKECNLPLLKKILAYKAGTLESLENYERFGEEIALGFGKKCELLRKFKKSLELDAEITRKLAKRLSQAIAARDISSIEKIFVIAQELTCSHVLKTPIKDFLVQVAQQNTEKDRLLAETLLQKTNLKASSFLKALYEACDKGSLECVELFIKYGADINSHKETLFQEACKKGSLSIVKALIDKVGLDAFDQIKKDLLPTACQATSSLEMLKFLLTTGKQVPIDYQQLFLVAAKHSGDLNVLQYLLDHGAQETFDSVKQSLLTECLRENRMKTFDFLVKNGADPKVLDVTTTDYCGNTLLHAVCKRGNLRGVEILLELGASCEVKNMDRHSPFDVAMVHCRYPIIYFFLEKNPSMIDEPILISCTISSSSQLDSEERDTFIQNLKEADFQKFMGNFAQDCLDVELKQNSLASIQRLILFFAFLQRDPKFLHQYAGVLQKLVKASFSEKSSIANNTRILNYLIKDTKNPLLQAHIALFCNLVAGRENEVEKTVMSFIQKSKDPVSFFLPLLGNPVTTGSITPFLIEHGSGILENCLKEIPLDKMSDQHKWYVLPYLPAEEIHMVMKRYPKKHSTLQQFIRFDGSGYGCTLGIGLQKMQEDWLPHEAAHPYIIKSLDRIHWFYFAVGAEDVIIRFLLMPFLRFMKEPSLYSAIPFVPADEFSSCLPDMGQNHLTALKGATLEQKRAFMAQEKHVTALLPPLYAEVTTKLEALQRKNKEERKIELPLLSSQIMTCHQRCIQQLDLIEKALIAKSVPDDFKEEIEKALAPHRARIESQKLMLATLMATLEKTEEIDPAHLCPITQDVMQNPVSAHGHTFEKEAIEQCLGATGEGPCPLCRKTIKKEELKSNEDLKKEIKERGYKSST